MIIPVPICSVLILIGAGTLCYSLVPASRILEEVPEGRMRHHWLFLRGLICAFLVGYLGTAIFFKESSANGACLVVSLVFFFGAVFVLLVCRFMVSTLEDVKKLAQLEHETIRDPLMNIFNRRYLDQRLGEEVRHSKRHRRPISLMLVDIDHFKRINDNHGHQAGDDVLRHVAAVIRLQVREKDVVARYGGDELAILLPEADEAGAWFLAERLRQEVTGQDCSNVKPTVSVGIATCNGDTDCEELVRRADAALYQAKKMGRDCCFAFSANYQLSLHSTISTKDFTTHSTSNVIPDLNMQSQTSSIAPSQPANGGHP